MSRQIKPREDALHRVQCAQRVECRLENRGRAVSRAVDQGQFTGESLGPSVYKRSQNLRADSWQALFDRTDDLASARTAQALPLRRGEGNTQSFRLGDEAGSEGRLNRAVHTALCRRAVLWPCSSCMRGDSPPLTAWGQVIPTRGSQPCSRALTTGGGARDCFVAPHPTGASQGRWGKPSAQRSTTKKLSRLPSETGGAHGT
jgi:hypothetical protein